MLRDWFKPTIGQAIHRSVATASELTWVNVDFVDFDRYLQPPCCFRPLSPQGSKLRTNLTGKDMAFVTIVLTRIIDYEFPTFGQFEFVDTSGKTIVIHEKLSIFGVDVPLTETTLPIEANMECSVISRTELGVLIDTEKPHGIADVHGRTRFHINADRIME